MILPSAQLISVVIPSYNHSKFIGRTLQSLLDQTYSNWEAIIVDNHSTDNTDEVIARYTDQRITCLKIHNHGVIAASRNVGIRAAKGTWVAFLDSDDWWAPQKLEISINTLEAGADLVYHDLYIARSLDQSVFNKRIVSAEPNTPVFPAILYSDMKIPNSSVVVSKHLLIQINGLSENADIIAFEDYDAWIRISRLTDKFVRIPECLGYYWDGGGNTSTASPIKCTRIIALYDQYLGELTEKMQNKAKGFLAYRIAYISQDYGDLEKSIKHGMMALQHDISFVTRLKVTYFLIHAALFYLVRQVRNSFDRFIIK